jgi:hypothetical protein
MGKGLRQQTLAAQLHRAQLHRNADAHASQGTRGAQRYRPGGPARTPMRAEDHVCLRKAHLQTSHDPSQFIGAARSVIITKNVTAE